MKIFAANWKLNKSPKETRLFIEQLCAELNIDKTKNVESSQGKQVVIFPSATCWEAAAEKTQGTAVHWGAQNVWSSVSGAFTGENSVGVLKELGGSYVLVGHSERRQIFNESDELLATKIKIIQQQDLIPMLCIGETLEQRQNNKTESVLLEQLKNGLKLLDHNKKYMIAYEPVWAIGTGQVATVKQVEETHRFVYECLKQLNHKTTEILYGGSVKPDNSKELIRVQHVDGFLIGGASLEVKSYLEIIRSW